MSDRSPEEALFDEKSLSELLRVYESAFQKPLLAKCLGLSAGLLVFVCLVVLWRVLGISSGDLRQSSHLMASYSLTVCSALMGVVIAGMSIFAASLNPKISSNLIETLYPNTNIPSLKFIFSMFAYVLSSLFIIIVECGVYYLVIAEESLVFGWLNSVFDNFAETAIFKAVLVIYVSVFFASIVFVGSILKSFIWNLHQVLLVVAVFNGRSQG